MAANFFQRITKQRPGRPVAGPFFGRSDIRDNSCSDLGIDVYTPYTKVNVFDKVYFWITITNHGKYNVTGLKTFIKANSELNILEATPQTGQYISGVWAIEFLGAGESYNLKLDFEVMSSNEYKPITVQAMISNSSHCDDNLWNNFDDDAVYVYDCYYVQSGIPINLLVDW